jgi:hypothetical protein
VSNVFHLSSEARLICIGNPALGSAFDAAALNVSWILLALIGWFSWAPFSLLVPHRDESQV